MPFYEYSCRRCDRETTVRHDMADTSPRSCPLCGGRLTRIISPCSIARSETDRIRDLSWIDRDLSGRLRKKAGGRLSPGLRKTLDRLDSD